MAIQGRSAAATIVVVVCLATGMSFVTPVGAQSSPVVTFGAASVSAEDTGTVSLVATGVPDDGVGAFEVTLVHDADTVDLSVEGTDRFQTTTSSNGSSGDVETTIVGYTGATSGDGGTVTLAALTLSATADGSSTLRVDSVATLADVDGNDLGPSPGSSAAVAAKTTDSSGAGSVGGGGSDRDSTTTTDGGDVPSTATSGPTTSKAATPVPTSTTEQRMETVEPTESTSATTTTEGQGPGFGVVVALLALVLAATIRRGYRR